MCLIFSRTASSLQARMWSRKHNYISFVARFANDVKEKKTYLHGTCLVGPIVNFLAQLLSCAITNRSLGCDCWCRYCHLGDKLTCKLSAWKSGRTTTELLIFDQPYKCKYGGLRVHYNLSGFNLDRLLLFCQPCHKPFGFPVYY